MCYSFGFCSIILIHYCVWRGKLNPLNRIRPDKNYTPFETIHTFTRDEIPSIFEKKIHYFLFFLIFVLIKTKINIYSSSLLRLLASITPIYPEMKYGALLLGQKWANDCQKHLPFFDKYFPIFEHFPIKFSLFFKAQNQFTLTFLHTQRKTHLIHARNKEME